MTNIEPTKESVIKRHVLWSGIGGVLLAGLFSLLLVAIESDYFAFFWAEHKNERNDIQVFEKISKRKYEALLRQLEDFSKQEEQQQLILKNLHQHIKIKDDSIAQLNQQISHNKESIKALLTDTAISKDTKQLIKEDHIEEAENRIDRHYEVILKNKESMVASAYFERGNIKELSLKYQQAKESYTRASLLQPENISYLREAGIANTLLGNYNQAIHFFEQALEIDLHQVAEDHPSIATTRNHLGEAWFAKGDFDKSISYYQQALVSDLKTYGKQHPNIARYHNNMGLAWQAKNDHERAIYYFEQALKSDLKTFDQDAPSIATYRNNLGISWQAKGFFDKAIHYFELALESDLNTYGESHPEVAIRRNNLGNAFWAKGELDKAIEYLEKALKSDLQTLGETHPKVANRHNNLGSVWYGKGELDKAIRYFELASFNASDTANKTHPKVATFSNNLGMSWQEKGDYQKAVTYFEQALTISRKGLGNNHPTTLTINDNLDWAKQNLNLNSTQ